MRVSLIKLMPDAPVWQDEPARLFVGALERCFETRCEDAASALKDALASPEASVILLYECAHRTAARGIADGVDVRALLGDWADAADAALELADKAGVERCHPLALGGALAAPETILLDLAKSLDVTPAESFSLSVSVTVPWSPLDALVADRAVAASVPAHRAGQRLALLSGAENIFAVDAFAAADDVAALRRATTNAMDGSEGSALALMGRHLLETQAELHDYFLKWSDLRKTVRDLEARGPASGSTQKALPPPVAIDAAKDAAALERGSPKTAPDRTFEKVIVLDEGFYDPAFHFAEVSPDGRPFRWMGRQEKAQIKVDVPQSASLMIAVHIPSYVDEECLHGLTIGFDGRACDTTQIVPSPSGGVIKAGFMEGGTTGTGDVELTATVRRGKAQTGDDRELCTAIEKVVVTVPAENLAHPTLTVDEGDGTTRHTILVDRTFVHSAFHSSEIHPVSGHPFRWMGRDNQVVIPVMTADPISEVRVHLCAAIDDECVDGFRIGLNDVYPKASTLTDAERLYGIKTALVGKIGQPGGKVQRICLEAGIVRDLSGSGEMRALSVGLCQIDVITRVPRRLSFGAMRRLFR